MLAEMKRMAGMASTVCGPVAPAELGRMLMHEHLHADLYDWDKDALVQEEKPLPPGRVDYLLQDAVPLLKESREKYGLCAYCDVTPVPWRGWPDIYTKISRASGVHIILCTGFYREIEVGSYFAKTPDRQIWSFVREASVEKLAEFCTREIVEGIHGTEVRAGVIKLGTSRPPMTPAEIKAFRAGARAQRETGVHITTHCTWRGAETSQLTLLEDEGVDLRRVLVGHTAAHLMDTSYRGTILEWMKRGANFLPTNLDVTKPEAWRPLIEAIHEVFDAGYGDKLFFGMDHGYCSESAPFERVQFMPQPPWVYMFTNVLPVFRQLGLTATEEQAIMAANPQRLVPVQ